MDLNFEKGVSIKTQLYKYRFYYILLFPVLLWYIVFSYLPMIGIVVAFEDYNPFKGFFQSKWVGFHWFQYLFSAREFGRVLRNTLLISFYGLFFGFPCPIILALLLNECRSVVFKRVVQTVSYLPHFISWTIVAGFLVTILSPSTGVVNQLLKMAGVEPIYFMAEPQYIRFIIVASGIWKGIGWSSILYIAALAGINPELYESAILDGAGKLKQTFYITLPGISHIIVMNLIFSVTGIFDVGFEQAYNLVNKATYDTGLVVSTYIYSIGVKQFQYSFTTAVGLAQSIVGLFMLLMANKVARKFHPEGAIW
jgi:putative aldouronate transport system permease protein